MRYAKIALNVPVKSTFTYHVPAELEPDLPARFAGTRGIWRGNATRCHP